MSELLFDEAYNRLNKAQKEAVDTIEGPVMVIAGPGTGKTQILTLRIANILKKTDTTPENILALTFTESGARAMRERLARYIGIAAYRVNIHTFHEFAGRCIREFPDAYEKRVGGRPITDLEKVTLIESILETPAIRILRPSGNPGFYVNPIASTLSTLKREYITPDHLAQIVARQENELGSMPQLHEKGAHKGKVRSEYADAEKKLKKNRELLFVYRSYEAALLERGYFDYDDMIFETVLALEKEEDMLRSLQETYQYILADEHQDVNGSQNRILELLASFHDRPNLFVVGDEKQSIYRFQGASLENFLYFDEKFPHVRVIALTQNYRSAQNILDLAHDLIKVEAGPAAELRIPLSAETGEKGVIEERCLSHEAVEHDSLVKQVKGLIDKGVPEEEIAIIVRTNREVEEFSRLLRTYGIQAEASADGDILEHPITGSVRALLGLVTDPANEAALFKVLQSGYLNIPANDLIRIMRARSYARPLMKILTDQDELTRLGVESIDSISRIVSLQDGARRKDGVEAPHRILEYLIRESGLLHYAMTEDPYEAGRVIRRLYDEVEEMVRHGEATTLTSIETMFRMRSEYGLPFEAPYIKTGKNSVSVMTAHKAKGLEFLHVFIPHLTDSRWGGKSHAEQFKIPITEHGMEKSVGKEDDERKLLYVAITRAKRGLYLSSASLNAEGREFLPTRLLQGVGEGIITRIDTTTIEEVFRPEELLLQNTKPVPVDSALLIETLRERGLSVTALNNYLRDPWSYFYRNVLRIPEVQEESLQFGTALHDTLESVMKRRREQGALPSVSDIKRYLERELSKLPITSEEYVRHHERGLVALTNYLAYVESTLPKETREEYAIEVPFQTGVPELPEIKLTGMLDRLDFDEEGNLLRVIDYKSGKPKTRGTIEGKTKDSDGGYKRQLSFYILLLTLQGDDRLKTREGVLSFVESDEKGRIHEEAYTITDEDLIVLRNEIATVVSEIANGAFLNAPCSPDSQYRELVFELQKRVSP